MPALTARALLETWEQAIALPPYGRALRMWQSLSNQSDDDTKDATVGQCDRGLIAIYRGLFGNELTCRANCPECNEDHELDLKLAMFDIPHPVEGIRKIRIGGATLHWRFPRAQALGNLVMARKSSTEIRKQLIQECVAEVRKGKKQLAFEAWPSELTSKLATVMSEADPLLDPRVSITCTACGHLWSVCFDIASFLWNEIDLVARRLMNEVHRLAMAYGWSESQILEMTAARRAAYLQMCAT